MSAYSKICAFNIFNSRVLCHRLLSSNDFRTLSSKCSGRLSLASSSNVSPEGNFTNQFCTCQSTSYDSLTINIAYFSRCHHYIFFLFFFFRCYHYIIPMNKIHMMLMNFEYFHYWE